MIDTNRDKIFHKKSEISTFLPYIYEEILEALNV